MRPGSTIPATTESGVTNGKKRQDKAARYGNDAPMLRTPAILKDRDTARRLRRGFDRTHEGRSVDAMARAACFSRRQFHRLTVEAIGETPGAHQRRLRLDRGAYLLLTSRATILEIALETGFENHETFTRAFRERFQVTPSEFRKNGGHELPWSMRAGFSIAVHIGCAKKNL
jgi:transcriptional regulator GlxA family with amidase domain